MKVSVMDTGMGIKDDSQTMLFDSFQRIDEEKNRNIEGTGLGLAITKRLVDLMNGKIELESQYGSGSTFTITVPQKIVDGTNLEKFGPVLETKKIEKEDDNLEALNGLNILIVDDVAINLKVFCGLLKNIGLNIDTALSGDECINMVAAKKYDMIFLDHMMPEKDGIETFNELRDKHADQIENVPIIMLTANAIAGVDSKYMGMGFDGYLSKPVARADLLRCIKEHML